MNNIVQMNQVKFTCSLKDRFKPKISIFFIPDSGILGQESWPSRPVSVWNLKKSFQQDVASGVVISDGSLVADPTEEIINLRDQVE